MTDPIDVTVALNRACILIEEANDLVRCASDAVVNTTLKARMEHVRRELRETNLAYTRLLMAVGTIPEGREILKRHRSSSGEEAEPALAEELP